MNLEDFEKLEKLGEGTYGIVHKVKNIKTGQIYALKKLKIEQSETLLNSQVLRELIILSQLKHENIVELVNHFYLDTNSIYLLFAYEDTVLSSVIETVNFPLCVIKSFCFQILQGIQYLHSNRILHRDIKPENILFNSLNGQIKIADFGLARQFHIPFEALTPEIQTLWYKSPELLFGETHYSIGVDIWAIGCVMAYLVLKNPLFKGYTELEMLLSIFSVIGTENLTNLSKLPFYLKKFPKFKRQFEYILKDQNPSFVDLLSKLLEPDPELRITANEALKHRFFDKQFSFKNI